MLISELTALMLSIQSEENEYLFIAKSQITGAGNGLFTAIPIYPAEIIAVFTGDILSVEESAARAALHCDSYFIELPSGEIMDCSNSSCFARFANDAKGISNSGIRNNAVIMLDEKNRVCIVAAKHIESGAEILCSYGKKYWKRFMEKSLFATESKRNETFS